MTKRQIPPDPDFEWTEAAPAPERPGSPLDAFNTGERDSFMALPEPPPEPQRDDGDGAEPAGSADAPRETPDPFTTEERPRGRTGRARRSRRGGTREHERRRERERQALERRRAGRPAPRGRLKRRDLPARVRRRQDVAIVAVCAAALVGAVALLTGGGSGAGGGPGIALGKLVGQTIVGKMGPGGPDKSMLREVRAGSLGSVIVLPHDAASLKADVGRLQKAARAGGNPPLLVMISQEGGYVKRLPGPPNTSPNDLGRSGSPASARAEGESTGRYLAGLGVDVNLAPLLDVTTPRTAATIATRTYGSNATRVAQLGVAFIQGQQAAGVAATAKHFPGLGLSSVDTDFGRSSVSATAAEQDAALAPFKSAIGAGVDLVMTSTAEYPNLGSQQPAALASAIVTGQLRGRLGFKGPIITDDLEGRGITDVTTPEQAAVAALRAGDDLLLFAHRVDTAGSAFHAVIRAARAGRLEQATLQAAYQRVVALKRSLAGSSAAAGR